MFDQKGRFIIEDYQTQATFASFLPGISGKNGIPIWTFYVNRGQGICSFGSEDKEHSIMEFYPATQAYQNTAATGFRTFLKVNGCLYEPFKEAGSGKTRMYIGMNELELEEINEVLGIQVNVLYFTLPNESLGGLVRKVTISNLSEEGKTIELLDGMPALLPYGVSLEDMKEMGQTVKAWMMVEDLETKLPYFKVRASIKDSTVVTKQEAGNFYFATGEDGNLLPVIVDPDIVFEYETSFFKAIGFMNHSIEELLQSKQNTDNNLPCAFFGKSFTLKSKQTFTLCGVVGKTETKEALNNLQLKSSQVGYFKQKREEVNQLVDEICKEIETKTGSEVFDLYCKQTYLDNILRGGYSITLGKDKVFYLYGRKHGDIERDYNFFSMLPEYYSQGNGNYRDINQNRRCDVAFHPFVKEKNIKTFYNMIQLDGYNPLLVQKVFFTLYEKEMDTVLIKVSEEHRQKLRTFLMKPFTPGSVSYFFMQEHIVDISEQEELLNTIIGAAIEHQQSKFGEGYWTDHWTYNLDLVENYLAIFPDMEEELLWKDKTYTYPTAGAYVRPRKERYVLTDKGVRQYNTVCEVSEIQNSIHYTSNLMTKLMILVINKYATLDAYGMGIEMEGGKPGWYDALNGLPGLFGSSMAETYELYRLNEFVLTMLKKYDDQIELPNELYEFLIKIENASLDGRGKTNQERFLFWDQVNHAKETYREQLQNGITGAEIAVSANVMVQILDEWQKDIYTGIQKAIEYGEGICPTYFYYELKEYETTKEGVIPKEFSLISMPHFLEGPVRYFKLPVSKEVKKSMYDKVKASPLYDEKLNMYKVNASLKDSSYEVGRAKAFTPGWLENESIWLHMEYKYLLELLKSGLYEEFFIDFHKAAIPFLDVKSYGRSILENSSFLVSSANPNEKLHGRGFVARLSGSTIEFLHMWQIMMFGSNPFIMTDSDLTLKFSPTIPDYLIRDEKQIRAVFLGSTPVTYHFEKDNLIPGNYTIISYTLKYMNGRTKTITGDCIKGEDAYAIRDNKMKEIEVFIC